MVQNLNSRLDNGSSIFSFQSPFIRAFIFIITLATLLIQGNRVEAQIVKGYFPYYRSVSAVNNVQYSQLTDIIYAFASLDGSGNLSIMGPGGTPDLSLFTPLKSNCAANGVRLWVAIGGWNLSSNFNGVASNSTALNNLANQCLTLCQTHNLAGIDIDWEFPQSGQNANYTALLAAIKNKIGPAGYKLSAALGGESFTYSCVNQGHAVGVDAAAFTYLDYFNIMSYDAPSCFTNHTSLDFMQRSMDGWNAKGCPYSKMVGGAAFYTRQGNMWSEFANTTDYNDANGVTSRGGIDTKATLQAKANYLCSKGAAGIMTWELSHDVTNTSLSLTKAMHDAIVACAAVAPVANFSANATTTCVNQSIIFTDASTGSPTSWSWNFGAGASPATATTKGPHTVTYSSSGTKTVSLAATNASGNNTKTQTNYITVNPLIGTTGSITGTSSVCGNSTGNIYSIPAVANATGYTWTVPTGASITAGSNTNSITVTFGTASGNITVTPLNSTCGNGSIATFPITINNVPGNAGSITGSNLVCPNQTGVAYSVTSVSGATGYTWTLPAGATIASGSNTNSITVNFGTTGGTVSVRPSNGCGNSASATTLSVGITTGAGNAGAITGSGTACASSTGNTYSIAAVTGASGYNWILPAGATITSGANTNSITVSFGTSSGTIQVTPTSACGNGTPKSIAVTLTAAPSAAGAINGTNSLCGGTSASYSISSVSGATSYNWTVPSGATITSGAGTTSINVSFGTTSGNVTVTPVNGTCSGASSNYAVTINNVPVTPGTITGNNGVCPNTSGVAYSIGSVAGATSYTWSYSGTGATISGSGTSVTVDYSSTATSGTLKVIANNTCGPSAASNLAISIGGGLSVTSGSRCGTGTVPLTVNTAGGPYLWYTNLTGGSSIFTGATYSPSVSATTTYYVDQSSVTSGSVGMTSSPGTDEQVWNGSARQFNTSTNTMNFTTSMANVTINSVDIYTGSNVQMYLNNFWITIENSGGTVLFTSPKYSIASSYPTSNPKFKTVPIAQLLATAGSYKMRIYCDAQTDAWGNVSVGQPLPVSSTGNVVTLNSGYSCFTNVKFQYGSSASTCGRTPVTAIVNSLPATPGTITGSASACQGLTGTYSIATVSGASSYNWTVPTGTTITSGAGTNSINVTYGSTSGNISVAAVNSCGAGTASNLAVTLNSPVTPSVSIATSANPVCSGNSVTFTANPTNGGAAPTYQWKKNGANVGTGATFTTSTIANGDIFTVVLTSNAACASPTTATSTGTTMTVSSSVVPSVTVTASQTTICTGTSVTFTANPTNGGSTPTYQWKKNGVNVGTGATFTTSTIANGDIFTVALTSNAACASPTTATSTGTTMTVSSSVIPSVTVTASQTTICAGTSVTFTANPTNGGTAPTYQWKKNGANVGTGATFTTSTIANGDIFTVVLTSNAACVSPTTATSTATTMTVSSSAVPSVTVTASQTTICTGTSVTFTANPTNGGSAPTYQWKKNGANVGTGATFTTSTIANGDIFTVVLTSNAACASPTTATSTGTTMTVSSSVVPSVTVTASQTTICTGTSVTFTANPTNGGTVPTYQWKKNGVNVGTGATFTTSTIANGDIFTVALTSNAACASPTTATSTGTTMTVSSSVVPSVTVTASQTTICTGTSVTFTANPTNGGTVPTYQWKKNGANVGTGATFTTSTIANGDIFTVVLTSNAACVSPTTATSTGTTMTVTSIPSKPSAFITSSSSVGKGDMAVPYSVSNVSGATSYNWSYNGTGASINNNGGSNVTIDFSSSATSGVLSVTASNSCGTSTTALTMDVAITKATTANPGPFTTYTNPVTQGAIGVKYCVANVPGTTYTWDYTGYGVTIVNDGTNCLIINFTNSATSGTLSVVADNGAGPSTPSNLDIIVQTPTGTIAPIEGLVLEAYPNPFQYYSNVIFDLQSGAPVNLEVYSILGVKVKTILTAEMLGAGKHGYQVSDLPNGAYVVRLRIGDKEKNIKLIKQE